MNHSRGTLVLMEQIIMVLVFALAAAMCVQVFVYASLQSKRNDERDRAVELAQSAAETLKHSGDDVPQAQNAAMEQLGGQLYQGEYWRIYYDGDWTETADNTDYVYRLTVQSTPSEVAGLAQASVRVERANQSEDDETLFELTAAWQEVDGHA